MNNLNIRFEEGLVDFLKTQSRKESKAAGKHVSMTAIVNRLVKKEKELILTNKKKER
jgi:hypothetical protein